MLDITRSPLLEGVTHGFLGRAGGVSDGIYSGLNIGLGSDDDRDAIMENRRRATEGVLPGSELVTVHQIHSADVVTAMQDRVVWAPGKCPIPGGQSITGFGHYNERYVRVDGRWKIAFLKLTRLTVEVHPAPVL